MMENFIREHYEDRSSWLIGRERIKGSHGASDAAVLVGVSKFKTIDEFYEEKLGRRAPEDLSNKASVQFGIKAEDSIRKLVELDFGGKYRIEHHPFDILRHKDYPFIYATLDGELTRLSDGEKGILEIKTGTLTKKSLEAWSSRHVPMAYYAQNCQQLLVTGWSYCIDVGRLMKAPEDDDESLPEVAWIYRYIDAKTRSTRESMQYVLEASLDFKNCVDNEIRPSTTLRWKVA